jgi:hypothetical protein
MRDDDLITEGFRELAREARSLPSADWVRLRAEIVGRTEALERATGRFQLLFAGLYGAAAVVVAVIALTTAV